jgi:hypothetical protein
MARPNFPMMGMKMPGMHQNMNNLSHQMQMNIMPPQMGGYPGMMHPPMAIHGKNLFFFK